MPRQYILKTTTPAIKEFQTLRKAEQSKHTQTLALKHRDILIDALLNYFHTLSNPNDILLQTKRGTSSLARYTLYSLLRDAGYTLATIAITLNRNPATITLGIEHFEKEIIDNPDQPQYSNAHMQKYAELPKQDLLQALRDLQEFNDELIQEGLATNGQSTEISLQQSEQKPSKECLLNGI